MGMAQYFHGLQSKTRSRANNKHRARKIHTIPMFCTASSLSISLRQSQVAAIELVQSRSGQLDVNVKREAPWLHPQTHTCVYVMSCNPLSWCATLCSAVKRPVVVTEFVEAFYKLWKKKKKKCTPANELVKTISSTNMRGKLTVTIPPCSVSSVL